MDQSSQATFTTDWDIRSTAQELHEDIFRALMWGIAGGCWLAQLAATVALSDEALVQVMAVGIALVANCLFALWLLRRHSLAARGVCYVGIIAIATVTMIITQKPMLGLLCVMLPAMVGLTISPAAGLLSEGLLSVWVYIAPGLPASWADLRMVVIAGGGVSLLLGWLVQYYYAAFAQWCLMVWQQARQEAEAARNQRLGFKQTQEDLLLANRELARLADRLKLLQQLAEEARRAKEEFVANVSHELRTPLNMIIGFSEMIPKLSQVYGVELPAALLSDIAAIQRNSQHLSKLVDDVLDLSQVEAGRMVLAKEWTALPELADEAALAVHALYESKGLYLHINVPENLPPVFCDSTRIRQVLLNLLSNAGRFTAHGGVQVQARHDHDHVIVTVTDTGSGIAADAQEKLFEPFQQLDGSIRRTHGGTGLGLSISKRFVEMHGGRMWLESEVGVGTAFHFRLPIEASAPMVSSDPDMKRWFSPYQEYQPRNRRSQAPVPDVTPCYVLLEKGKTLQHLMRRYQPGMEAIWAGTFEQAIEAMSHSPAQVLLVNMPPAPGTTPADRLTMLPYNTPVITCWLPGEDEVASQLGVVRYLLKPVSREALLAAVERLGPSVKNVLLVDDEPEMLRLFARMLASATKEYHILQATSGRRALHLLRDRRPDVMLLDLMMPGMDGFQVLRAKSQDAAIRQIPTILVSARDPGGEPVVSSTLTVTRTGGLTGRELLECVQAVSEILSPSHPRGQQGEPPG